MTRVAQHILTFAQTLDGGGVERAQLRLAADWIAAGRRVTLSLGVRRGPLAAEIPAGLRVVERGSPSYLSMFDLPDRVAALAPDILFCPGNHYSCIAAWTWLQLGGACPPIVAKMSNTLIRAGDRALVSLPRHAWSRLQPRFVDHLVAMTPGMAEEASRLMGMPAARISVIANPSPRSVTGAPQPPLPDGRFILGIGRLERQKRWDRLILAMRAVALDAKLVILGEGSMRVALEKLVAEHGLSHRVSLPGHALEPAAAIRHAAAVALVSDYEGAPGVLREALALGTPVVTTDSSVAIREIVTRPSQGDVVSCDDSNALASALDRWLDPRQPRPAPSPEPKCDSSGEYLALFDRLAARPQPVARGMMVGPAGLEPAT